MNYKESSIFSGKQKVDSRNLCLYFNFKNEKSDNIFKLMKLIEKYLIEKFEEDFVFDMELNGESITSKSLHKKFNNIGNTLSRNINLIYDAILQNDKISSRADYRNLISEKIFMDDWDMKTPNFKFDLNDINSIKDYIIKNIESDEVDYLREPTPQDIGLNFSCDYIEKEKLESDEEIYDDYGYYGSMSFNISGYILDYNFEYFTVYLKDFVKKSGEILKSLCANIFISEKTFKTEYFDLFGQEIIDNEDNNDKEIYDEHVNHHRYGFLSGIEGINFISKDLFFEINKELLEDDFFEVEIEKNGVFININKTLEDVNIHDKHKIRKILDEILIKGYCDHNLIHFVQFLGKVPIYIDEVFLVESLEDEVREDLYNKYFVITKNKEIESLNLNTQKYRIYKL